MRRHSWRAGFSAGRGGLKSRQRQYRQASICQPIGKAGCPLIQQTHSYQILDVSLAITSDSRKFIDLIDVDYASFRDRGNGQTAWKIDYRGKGGTLPFLRINDSHYSLCGHPAKEHHAYRLLLKRLFSGIRKFILLHAGVAAGDRGAVIISGPPGSGKTTIIRELLKRDFSFFSDDFCPIHRETGLIHPFRRTLWTTPFAPGRGPYSAGERSVKGGKIPLRVDALPSPASSGPVEMHALVYLDTGAPPGETCTLKIGLKNDGGRFIHEIMGIEGTAVKRLDQAHSEWEITYPLKKGLTGKVRDAIERHGEEIWNVYRTYPHPPDFLREPSLVKWPGHEATRRLMAEMKDDLFVAGTREDGDSPARRFMMLNSFLDGVPCYRLSVGRLDRTMELIAEVAG